MTAHHEPARATSHRLIRMAGWLWRQIDPIVALAIGVTAAVLAALNKIPSEMVAPLMLSTISLVAFTIMRDREQRHELATHLKTLERSAGRPRPDEIFAARTSEIPVVGGAQREVWAVQETGSLLVETCRKELATLLDRGGRVRLVLPAPTEATLRRVAFRNASLTDYHAILSRVATFQHLVRDLCKGSSEIAARVEVRYIPDAIGETFVLTDPSGPADPASALVRVAGFGVPFERKLDFAFRRDTSTSLFAHYCEQFERLYLLSSKIVLITGKPKSGKTTLIDTLLNDIGTNASIFSVVSPAELRGDQRVGFAVRTSNAPARPFAGRVDGEYSVDASVWDTVAEELNDARLAGKILVVDEIGPMQARSAKFRQAIEDVLSDEKATMIATLAGSDEFALRTLLLQHPRSSVFSLDRPPDRHYPVASHVRRETDAAMNLYRMMPRDTW